MLMLLPPIQILRADVAAVDPIVLRSLLANGLSTFPIKTKPLSINGPRSLLHNPPNCTI